MSQLLTPITINLQQIAGKIRVLKCRKIGHRKKNARHKNYDSKSHLEDRNTFMEEQIVSSEGL